MRRATPKSYSLCSHRVTIDMGWKGSSRRRCCEVKLLVLKLRSGLTLEEALKPDRPTRSDLDNASANVKAVVLELRRGRTLKEALKSNRLTMADLAKEAGVSPHLLGCRLGRGWAIEEALGLVRKLTLSDIAREAGVRPCVFKLRLDRGGWTMEEAIGLVGRAERKDTETISYKARQRGINPSKVHSRLELGWTLEEALEIVERVRPENTESVCHKARQHGLSPGLVQGRVQAGWTLDEALGITPHARPANTGSLAYKARQHGLPYNVVKHRVSTLGWPLEKALTTPPKRTGGPAGGRGHISNPVYGCLCDGCELLRARRVFNSVKRELEGNKRYPRSKSILKDGIDEKVLTGLIEKWEKIAGGGKHGE